jgi:hypothetical protein
VFAYPYQWNDERHIENPKNRTTCLAIRRKASVIKGSAIVHLFLLGISDRPRPHQTAIEIPPMEKRRAGLQVDRPAYVVISEYNYDVLPHSWHYEPDSADHGTFSLAFTDATRRAFLQRIKDKLAARNDRTT